MGSPRKRSALSSVALTVLLAAAFAFAWMRLAPEVRQQPVTAPVAVSPAAPAGPAAPAAPPVGQATAVPDSEPLAPETNVEVVPPAEEAPPVVAEQPASFGRRAGLHKVKDDLHLTASAALVVDQQTGEVLMRKNDDAVLPMASLTKLMTALIVTEARLPLDQNITITDDDVDGERHSRSRLRVGSTLTRGEALHLALMSSENRAAHALGRTFPGGLEAFVKAMNRKAAALGMKSTTYVDPTGLSTSNQSTARDLALLAAAASKNALVADYSTDRQHRLEIARGRVLQYNNSNRLVKNPQWDIMLQKTGYIVEAGWCMVLDTKISGRKLVVVLLDAGGRTSRTGDAERIKRWVVAQAGNGSGTSKLAAGGGQAKS